MKRAFSVLALLVGVSFGYVAARVGLQGTGAQAPVGVDVLEGRVAAPSGAELIDSPVGEPFLYGEIRLTKGGSRAIDTSWRSIVGSPAIEIDTGGRKMPVRLPHPERWRSAAPPTFEEIRSLDGLPHLEGIEGVDRLGPPPYLLIVTAVRPGDAIIARAGGEEARDVHLGTREEIDAWVVAHERGRWPIVGLMALMAIVSLGLGIRGLGAKSA